MKIGDVTEFVHETLSPPFLQSGPGIVPARFKGIHVEHAGIISANSFSYRTQVHISDVEAVASGAEVRAGTAPQASGFNFLPEFILENQGEVFLRALDRQKLHFSRRDSSAIYLGLVFHLLRLKGESLEPLSKDGVPSKDAHLVA
jgi:hypothetical protein